MFDKRFPRLRPVALLVFVLAISSACSVRAVLHNPESAVSIAVRFADYSLVRHDFLAAYRLLKEEKPVDFDVGRLQRLIEEMHQGHEMPEIVEPYMYRVLPQSSTINVYLEGRSKNSKTFYNITLLMSGETGYVVSECFRNPERVVPDAFSTEINVSGRNKSHQMD